MYIFVCVRDTCYVIYSSTFTHTHTIHMYVYACNVKRRPALMSFCIELVDNERGKFRLKIYLAFADSDRVNRFVEIVNKSRRNLIE